MVRFFKPDLTRVTYLDSHALIYLIRNPVLGRAKRYMCGRSPWYLEWTTHFGIDYG
jgi:hypothetical protein